MGWLEDLLNGQHNVVPNVEKPAYIPPSLRPNELSDEDAKLATELMKQSPPESFPANEAAKRAEDMLKKQLYYPHDDMSVVPSMYDKNLEQARKDIENEKSTGFGSYDQKNKPDNAAEAKRLQEKLNAAKAKEPEELPDEADDAEEESPAPKFGGMADIRKADDTERAVPDVEEPEEVQQKQKAQLPPPRDYMQALMQAQGESGRLAGLQMMGKGAERIGSALARTQHDKDYLNEMNVKAPVEDVINQQKMETLGTEQEARMRDLALKKNMDDPNSDVSNMARQILKKGAPSLKTDNLTATEMNQLVPGLKTILETEMNRETKMQLGHERNLTAKEKSDEKKQKDLDSANTRFVQQVMSVKGDKALNNQKETVRRVDNAFSIINNPTFKNNPDLIPAPMVAAVTMDLNTIMAGGVGSQEGYKELANPTVYGKLSKAWSGIANKPTGAKLGAFINQNAAILQDLKQNAQKGIKSKYDYIDSTLGPHMRPEDRQRSKESFYQEFLGQQPAGAMTDAQNKAVDAFMKTNGIADKAQAIEILKQAGKL